MDDDAHGAMIAVEPESPRYATDLVFLPGLWARSDAWGRVAAAMAHRGWRCWLLDPRVGAAAGGGLAAWAANAEAAIAGFGAPPVLVGHDAGALVALALAAAGRPSAAIAVAPLVEGVDPLLVRRVRWRARLLGGAVDPPPASHPVFASCGGEEGQRVLGALGREAAATIASVRGGWLAPRAPAVPALVVGQEDDPAAPAFAVEVLANGIGADFVGLAGGHWPMARTRIDAWTGRLHRWLVHRLGERLLLLRGDEDLRED